MTSHELARQYVPLKMVGVKRGTFNLESSIEEEERALKMAEIMSHSRAFTLFSEPEVLALADCF